MMSEEVSEPRDEDDRKRRVFIEDAKLSYPDAFREK